MVNANGADASAYVPVSASGTAIAHTYDVMDGRYRRIVTSAAFSGGAYRLAPDERFDVTDLFQPDGFNEVSTLTLNSVAGIELPPGLEVEKWKSSVSHKNGRFYLRMPPASVGVLSCGSLSKPVKRHDRSPPRFVAP